MSSAVLKAAVCSCGLHGGDNPPHPGNAQTKWSVISVCPINGSKVLISGYTHLSASAYADEYNRVQRKHNGTRLAHLQPDSSVA